MSEADRTTTGEGMSRQRGRRRRPPTDDGGPKGVPPWVLWSIVGTVIAVTAITIALLNEPTPDVTPGGSGDPVAGEAVFLRHCALCHGTDLLGTVQGPPLLHVIYAPNHHSDEAFRRAIEFGSVQHHWDFGPMLPVPGLSADEVESVIAYVRQEQQAAGILRDPAHP